MPDQSPPSARWAPTTVLAAAVALGIASGLVEVAIHAVRKYGMGRILAFGNDVVWMAPLANSLVLLAAFIPFFPTRELVRVFGNAKMFELFFQGRQQT